MSSIEIIPMENKHIDQAARIIAKSFQTEEFARNTFDFSDPQTEALFAELLKIELVVFMKHSEKVDVAMYGDEMAGVYSVKVTGGRHGFSNLKQTLKKLRKVVPVAKRVKYKKLYRLHKAMQQPRSIPKEAVLLEILAVSPDFQGRGVGSAMMNSLDDYSQSVGRPIYLYTGNAENVSYYEKLGYRTMETIQKKDFTAYHMLKDLSGAQ
ncbi:GNAT family N-acetyltransferase [Lacicoccus alkaliphilus]|uniref:Acetyltransferase (GNAT) domain-containing protein n=1 Tax=Lacicoccus alkaliphilus DSM 16010 TaxID=1123231 RepID=A0A1M7HHR9_9BACL|nr:GNAT family N-acetyltransferase [Salinicoccus alkaliphilus]SHM27687.1 Acetyltransferase (GNAT) domain-containing protein [Salinicoccus alkaliphilus DSM 16010]